MLQPEHCAFVAGGIGWCRKPPS